MVALEKKTKASATTTRMQTQQCDQHPRTANDKAVARSRWVAHH
jgi:hypothetical protein